MNEFYRLVKIVQNLRDPEKGCPWDIKQTHKSLAKNIIEETYEFIHSIEEKDKESMQEELGDILLQVILHSIIAEENQDFNLELICKKLSDKLIRRHPHVFNNKDNKKITASKALENWENIKINKENKAPINQSYLSFPSLYSSYKIGQKSKKINFDWDNANECMDKIEEELQELKQEINNENINKDRIEEEIGDLLFTIAQFSRHLNLNAEEVLRKSNKKFISRFLGLHKILISNKLNWNTASKEQLNNYWEEVKQNENK